jgi:hypothetical protein
MHFVRGVFEVYVNTCWPGSNTVLAFYRPLAREIPKSTANLLGGRVCIDLRFALGIISLFQSPCLDGALGTLPPPPFAALYL